MPNRPPDDPSLRETPGVAGVPSINPAAVARPRRSPVAPEAFVDGLRAGDRRWLSQAITLVESTRPEHQAIARDVVAACLPHAGRSIRVGITGAPGVGKSTFIEALGVSLTRQGHRLAVFAVDPTSTRTQGSILGDKTRMSRLAADPNAFIRPSPSAGSLGGVTRSTRQAITLAEAAGYDVILVETVGVGQSEVAVHALVDFFLLLVLAGAGDELQGIKRGIVEMADALVVNKADGENRRAARRAQAAYRSALRLFPTGASGWAPPVLTCSAREDEGIDAVWATVERFRTTLQASGHFDQRRQVQALEALHRRIEHLLVDDFFAHPGVSAEREGVEAAVLAGTMSPEAAAQHLLAHYHSPAATDPGPGAVPGA